MRENWSNLLKNEKSHYIDLQKEDKKRYEEEIQRLNNYDNQLQQKDKKRNEEEFQNEGNENLQSTNLSKR